MMGKDKENPIKVYARVRPLTRREIENDDDVVLQTYYDNVKKIKICDRRHLYESTYLFDRVFSAADNNETVYTSTAKNYITKVLNGTNCSLIAFGQTGSGKTHTLMADGGVTDYAITELFKRIHADTFHRYRVTCTFVQIYLEKVFDILGGTMNSKIDLPVREHPYRGIHVQGLSEHVVSDAFGVYDLFNLGKKELIKAETEMGHLSSRSHSIFQLSIEKTNHPEFFNMLEINSNKKKPVEEVVYDDRDTETPKTSPEEEEISAKTIFVEGKLAICDLAGSERFGSSLVEKTIQTEAKYINSSLLQLGNVIYALSDKKERKHIPFRNSTLTRLLQECLGSKCTTAFIICVAPSCNDIHETACSLNFGTRARTITNKVRINNSRENQEFINKRLSSRIFHLENKLRRKRTPQSSHQHTQMDNACREDSYSILDITKYSLELSELLNLILKDSNNYDEEKSKRLKNSTELFENKVIIHQEPQNHQLNSTLNRIECSTTDEEEKVQLTENSSKKCHFQLEQQHSSEEEYIVGGNQITGILPKKLSDISDHESDSGCIRASLDDGSDASDITVDFNDDFDVNDNRIFSTNNTTINNCINVVDKYGTNKSDQYNHYSNHGPDGGYDSVGFKNDSSISANVTPENTNVKALSTFIETSSNVSRIILEIQIQIEKMDSRKSDTILETFSRCRYCLDSFQHNVLKTNNSKKEHRKFVESACTSISELCKDVQYDITTTVKQMDESVHMDNTSTEHAWFACLNSLLTTFENDGYYFHDAVNKSLIYYLVFTLQLLQIIRLTLVNSTNSLTEPDQEEEEEGFTTKPLKCSTSLEDTTVSSTTSGERIIDRIPSIRPALLRNKEYLDSARKKNYVCKLFRQPSIKIKTNYLNNLNNTHPCRKQNECDSGSYRRSFRYESIERFYSEKKRKSFQYNDNDNSDKIKRSKSFSGHYNSNYRELSFRSRVKRSKSFGEKRELSHHDRQLMNMYYEIQRKYEEALEENNILWANMNNLEVENTIELERARFQEEIQKYYADFKKTEDKLIATEKECLRYEKILEHAENVLQLSTNDIDQLESCLDEKNETIYSLECDKQQTILRKEIHIEQHKKMEEIRQGIILFQQIFEMCITLSEELLNLSADIEKKVQYGTKNFESIKDLESEVYKLIESNARYECVLHDICDKVRDSLFTIDEMHQKTNQSFVCENQLIELSVTKEFEKSNKKIKNDVQTTHAPNSSSRQDTSKLTEIILSCDEEIIQTILVDDLRSSTDKNYIMLKDIRTSAMIKQLIREKSKLEDNICDLKEMLIQQDEDLAQNKQKINLFVNELGKLDQQLNGSVDQPQYCYDFSMLKMGSRYTTFPRAHENIEIISVPEMCYDKFTLYLHYYTNNLPPPRPKPVKREPPEGTQMILVEELDDLKSEIDFYKRKCKEIEMQHSKLNTCFEQDLSATNKSLLCKIDYMKQVNSIVEKENRDIKNKNLEQKNQMKTLKDENTKIQEQVEACRCQSMQIQTKTEISRLQLEKKLSKYNDKLESLENYIEAIIDQKETLKQQFNDSGLPNEDSSDTCTESIS